MKINKIFLSGFSFRNMLISLFIFLIIYVSSSYNLPVINGSIALIISIICGFFIYLLGDKKKFDSKFFLIVILISLSVLITSLFKNDSMQDMLIMILVIWVSLFIISGISFQKYSLIYRNIIFFISTFSLFVYFVALIFPNIIRMFPTTYYRPGFEVYNLGLSFINLDANLIRNMSIFWEPGAYQTFLVFAILFEVFSLKIRKKVLVVLFASLITTWSTIGLINILILLMIIIIKANSETKVKLKYVNTIVTLLIFFIFVLTIYPFLPSNIQYAFLGKITAFLSSDKNEMTSATVRLDSIVYPFTAFMNSPILGAGYNGLKESVTIRGHTMTTNTPVNWFSSYGIFFGMVFSFSIINFARRNAKTFTIIILITVVIFSSMISENYLRNISIITLLLYGLSGENTVSKTRN